MTPSILIGTTAPGEPLPPLEDFADPDAPHKIVTYRGSRIYLILPEGRMRVNRGDRILLEYGDEPGVVVLNESRSYHLPKKWIFKHAWELYGQWLENEP